MFLVVDVNPKSEQLALPMEAYVAVEDTSSGIEEQPQDGEPPVLSKKFSHLPYDVATLEAEDIGVEHLLRDIPSRGGQGTVSERIENKERALRSLQSKLLEVKAYLVNVVEGRLPANQRVLDAIQDMFNMLPKVTDVRQYTRAFAVESNDMLAAVYVGALTRAVIGLHELILNKYEYRDAERKMDKEDAKKAGKEDKDKEKEKEKEKDKEGESKEGKEEDKSKQ